MDGKRRRKTRQEWAEIMEAQAKSGRSAAGYCREHEIDYKRFLYHRKRARRAARPIQGENLKTSGIPSFIPISIPQSGSIRIILAKGVVLESDRLPDVDWLIEFTAKLSEGGKVAC